MNTERMQINDIPEFGTELSEDDLRLAIGGMRIIDIRCYDQCGRLVDEVVVVEG
jgi:hypothetical protein